MNRIEQLIAELCPDGVEYKELWEVTAWDKKFNGLDKYMQKRIINYPYVLANKFKELELERGNVRLLSTGNYIGWTTEELAGKHLCHGEIVAIPWGGKANVKYYKGKFVTADNRIATSINTNVLLNKFLYYWMLVNTELIESFYRGAGIKHPSMKSVLTMKIPIPPLPIQQEIVTILDTFTDLDAELQAELEARKKQYEHYRNQLLNFEGKEVECKMLGDLSDFMNGKGHEKEIVENGKYIVVNSKFISTDGTIKKYSNNQLSPIYIDDILIVMSDLPNGKALAKCFYVTKDNVYTLNQRIGRLSVNYKYEVIPKYMFFILNRNKQLLKYDNGSDQTNLRKNQILEIKIPIPPLSEQERIVSILDKFEALVNEELPAEIAARRKQYEYYREKLLRFERLVS